MPFRNTFNPFVCLALVASVSVGSVYSQESIPNRNFHKSIQPDIDELDPGVIESELIEGTVKRAEVRNRISPLVNSEAYFSESSSERNASQPESPKPETQNQKLGNSVPPAINSGMSSPPPAPERQFVRQPGMQSNVSATGSNPGTMPVNKNDMYETRSTPTVQTQIVAPRTINVNQTARMFIHAQNIGKVDVNTFKLIATLPNHAKFVNSVPLPTNVNGQIYEFTLNSLNANGKQVVQLDVVPTAKLPLNISTQIQIESQQQVAVVVQEPVLDVTVDGPETIQTGQTIKHIVTVKNIGDGIAEGVRIKSELPENLDTVKEQQNTLVPKLIPGQVAKFELSSYARSAGDANVIFQVSASGTETREGRTSIRVIRPELGVQILGPRTNYLGREGTYSIQLENASEIGINDVQVKLNIPDGLQINTISQAAKVDQSTGTLSWNFANIPGKQQQVIQFRAKSVTEGSQVCRVTVQTRETGARQMSLNTDVLGRANLSIRVSDSGEPLGIGNKADFVIEVANQGSRNADRITIQVDLPSALTPVNQQGYTVDASGNQITFQNISVAAGSRKTFKFQIVAVAAGEHVVRSTVSLEDSTQSISSENSVFVFETENAKVSEALVPEIRR